MSLGWWVDEFGWMSWWVWVDELMSLGWWVDEFGLMSWWVWVDELMSFGWWVDELGWWVDEFGLMSWWVGLMSWWVGLMSWWVYPLYGNHGTLSREPHPFSRRIDDWWKSVVIFRSVFCLVPTYWLRFTWFEKHKKSGIFKKVCICFLKQNQQYPTNQPTGIQLKNCFKIASKLGYDDYAIFINHLDELPGGLKRWP